MAICVGFWFLWYIRATVLRDSADHLAGNQRVYEARSLLSEHLTCLWRAPTNTIRSDHTAAQKILTICQLPDCMAWLVSLTFNTKYSVCPWLNFRGELVLTCWGEESLPKKNMPNLVHGEILWSPYLWEKRSVRKKETRTAVTLMRYIKR